MSQPPLIPIVLAAGSSTRMGGPNKLLRPVEGVPTVRRVVEAMVVGTGVRVVVVVGHEAERVREVLRSLPVVFVTNPRHREGMGTSVAAGVAAAPPGGVLVCLGDLPWLTPATVRAVVERYGEPDRPDIVQPVHQGRPGHPVACREGFRAELAALKGDQGAQALVRGGRAKVTPVSVPDAGIHRDVDTPADFDRLPPRQPS